MIGQPTLRASGGWYGGSWSTFWKAILSTSSWCISIGVFVPLSVDGLIIWSKGNLVDCESYKKRRETQMIFMSIKIRLLFSRESRVRTCIESPAWRIRNGSREDEMDLAETLSSGITTVPSACTASRQVSLFGGRSELTSNRSVLRLVRFNSRNPSFIDLTRNFVSNTALMEMIFNLPGTLASL